MPVRPGAAGTIMRASETQRPSSVHAARRSSHGAPVDTDPDHSGRRAAGAAQLPAHVLPLERFHGVPVETQFLWMVDRGFSSQARLPGP